MSRRRLSTLALTALTALLAAAAAGCGGGGDDASSGGAATATLASGDVISMKGLRFHPDHAQVKVGQKVTWRDDESVPHDVVADSGAEFKSSVFGKNKTYSFTPTAAGTIAYECTLHPGMKGTLEVVAD
jgi:plastocyanin